MPISVRLPFAGKFTVTQTPSGLTSHTDDYSFGKYNPAPLVNYWTAAYDFAMPRGTKILAIAPGEIVDFREDVVEGQKGPSHNLGNFITIRHNPGTASEFYATYNHLQQNGVLVEGGKVVAGQLIGYSGNTGLTEGPHLHLGFGKTSFPHQSGDILALATDAQDSLINFNGTRPSLNAEVTGAPEVYVPPVTAVRQAQISDASATEGGSLVFTVSLDKVASADTKVYYETKVGSALGSDFAGSSGYVLIKKGFMAATLTLSTVDDRLIEGSETMSVVLKATPNVIAIGDGTGIGTIRDNDVAAASPDLVIQNVRIDDSTVRPGQTVKVSWDALNIGSGDAAATDQFIFVSTDRTLSSNDRYVDHETLGTMSVGERDAEYEYFTMPSNLARGHYYIGVYADGGLDAAEVNESNNIAWISYDIV